MISQYGAVAQLGARLNGIEEARGSNPLSSTSQMGRSQRASVERLGYLTVRRERVLLATVAALAHLVFGSASTARAQSAPDVLVLVQPVPGGQMVSVTYPNRVEKQTAAAALARIALAGRWRVADVVVEHQSMPAAGGQGKDQVHTGVTAALLGSSAMADGTLTVQPFVNAFADKGRLDLAFMVPADPGFRGLRLFDDGSTRVELTRAGAPYRYEVTYRKPGTPPASLPLTQELKPPPSNVEAAKVPESRSGAAAVFISSLVALALLLGWVVYQRARGSRMPGQN